MRAEADTFSSTSSCVVVDVAPVEHGVLGRADVDERRLHARQDVLDLAQVDVAVDLAGVVGRAGHVVLDERPALEDRDLGGLGPDVDRHQVAADGPALALPAPPPLERLLVELDRRPRRRGRRPGPVPRPRPGPDRPASGGAWWPRPRRRPPPRPAVLDPGRRPTVVGPARSVAPSRPLGRSGRVVAVPSGRPVGPVAAGAGRVSPILGAPDRGVAPPLRRPRPVARRPDGRRASTADPHRADRAGRAGGRRRSAGSASARGARAGPSGRRGPAGGRRRCGRARRRRRARRVPRPAREPAAAAARPAAPGARCVGGRRRRRGPVRRRLRSDPASAPGVVTGAGRGPGSAGWSGRGSDMGAFPSARARRRACVAPVAGGRAEGPPRAGALDRSWRPAGSPGARRRRGGSRGSSAGRASQGVLGTGWGRTGWDGTPVGAPGRPWPAAAGFAATGRSSNRAEVYRTATPGRVPGRRRRRVR